MESILDIQFSFEGIDIGQEEWENFVNKLLYCDENVNVIFSSEVGKILVADSQDINREALCSKLEEMLFKEIALYGLNEKIRGRWLKDGENKYKYLTYKNIKIRNCSVTEQYDKGHPENKELDIRLQNDVTTYLHYSLPLCIILSNSRLLPRYFEHFIEICARIQPDGYLDMDFLEHSHLFTKSISNLYFGYDAMKDINILDFIRKKINSDTYIIIHLDEFYLPHKLHYQKTHYIHASLVYGYDDCRKKIMTIGFDSKHAFTKIEIDYAAFEKSYEMGKVYYEETAWWAFKKAIQLVKFNTDVLSCEYEFHLDKFINKLDSYMASSGNPAFLFEPRVGERYIFGFQIYEVLEQKLLELAKGNNCTDFRALHLLSEHKKSIYKRLEYIVNNCMIPAGLSDIPRKYSTIVEQVEIIRMKFLKYSLTHTNFKDIYLRPHDELFIRELTGLLEKVREEEKTILTQIRNQLQSAL